jgi:hypothetical protein
MNVKKRNTLQFTPKEDHKSTWEMITAIAEQTQKEAIEECLRYLENIKEVKLNQKWLSIITEEQALKLFKGIIQVNARKYKGTFKSIVTYEE